MGAEKILMNYDLARVYKNDLENWIGPEDGSSDAESLRSSDVVPYNASTHKCIRQFGTGYSITSITNAVIVTPRSDGGGTNQWKYEFYDIDTDTLIATVTDQNASTVFTFGTAITASTGIYIKLVWISGTVGVQAGDTIGLTTSKDVALMVPFPKETITSGEIIYALSDAGSTYYAESIHDQTMMHGGYRHTPTGTDRLPYTNIAGGYGALTGAFDYAHILDDSRYNEKLGWAKSSTFLQSASGNYPVVTYGVGQRAETSNINDIVYASYNAIFVNENGNDADDGSWQTPKKTIAGATSACDATHTVVVYGGAGATVSGGIFFETISGTGAFFQRLTKEYGYMPRLESPDGSTTITANASAIPEISGWYIKNSGQGIGVRVIDFNGNNVEVYDCTIEGGEHGIDGDSATAWDVVRCHIFGSAFSGVAGFAGNNANIEFNLIHGCLANGIYADHSSGNFLINDNICYANGYGINLYKVGGTMGSAVEFNTCYGNNLDGFFWNNVGCTMSGTLTGNISVENDRDGFATIAGGTAVTLTHSNAYGNGDDDLDNVSITAYNGNDGNDARAVDPLFIDPDNNNFALSSASTLKHIQPTEDDIGARWGLFHVNQDDVSINGIEFDGQSMMHDAIYKEGSNDWEGTILKYCRCHHCNGLAIDDYGDGTTNPTETDIDNSIFDHNGEGPKLWAGDNTVDNTISFKNTINNFFDLYNTDYNHAISYGAQNGFNFAVTGFNSSITNSIINGNSVSGVTNAGVTIYLTYCCITDAVVGNVDISATSNFTDNPLFISVEDDAENFNIKTIEAGYSIDSACKDAGSSDVGAWQLDRGITSYGYRKYEFEFNPKTISFGRAVKGFTRWEDGFGGSDNWAKGFKRTYNIKFSNKQVSSEELRNKIEAFTMMMKNRMNSIEDDSKTIFRLHLKKDTFFETGTGTIDATAKTIVDATKSFDEFQWQGFHVGVKYDSGTGTGTISASGKTLTVSPSPVWAVDEWEGYYIYVDGYYYIILSNTANVLTVSDPLGTLADASNIDWAIEKYFKITVCDGDTLTVNDPDGELPDGSYDYYIDFIECRLQRSGFGYSQPTFVIDREHSKTGYSIRLEEI